MLCYSSLRYLTLYVLPQVVVYSSEVKEYVVSSSTYYTTQGWDYLNRNEVSIIGLPITDC
jgi:hypothetical protein